MSPTPRLFKIDAEKKQPEVVQEVEFSTEGLQERYDIQEWIAADPRVLGDDLLIVAKEFSDFDKPNDRFDLMAVDRSGRLVISRTKARRLWSCRAYASDQVRQLSAACRCSNIIRILIDTVTDIWESSYRKTSRNNDCWIILEQRLREPEREATHHYRESQIRTGSELRCPLAQ